MKISQPERAGGRGRPREKASKVPETPPPSQPVARITRPVRVQIRKVSKTVAVMEIRPCSRGLTPQAEAAAMGAVPRPASLEKIPRLTPAVTVPRSPAPADLA